MPLTKRINMKSLITTLLLMLLCTSTFVLADDSKYMHDEMMKCDTNKDGMISKDEFIKSKTEMFMKMDKDSNAKLDASEQKMMIEKMHTMRKDYDDTQRGMMRRDS